MAKSWLKHLGMSGVVALALAGCGENAGTSSMEQDALKARLEALKSEAQVKALVSLFPQKK